MKRLVWLLAFAMMAIIVAGGIWLWLGWTSLHRPINHGAPASNQEANNYEVGAEDPAIEVEISAGTSARSIIDQLAAAGALPKSPFPELFYRFVLENPPLQAGEYSIPFDTTAVDVFEKLTSGDVVTRPLVIIEGLTVAEIAATIEQQGFGLAEEFLAAATPDLIQHLDPDAPDLEGYLFPDTYQFPRSAAAIDIVGTMIQTFDQKTRQLRSELDGVGLRELVTLASIVEKETQNDSERSLVSGVYRNRLDQGIGLYADPTIIFALKKGGTWDGNLRKSDLQVESPYNTYRVYGLPPGPICSPGLSSLEAAAHPSPEPYLYFVSRNDGTHVFARTLREHNRNVNTWQRQYWRKKWQEESRSKSAPR